MHASAVRNLVGTLTILLFATGCGPFIPLASGELTGNDTPVPATWELLDDVSTVQVETRPIDPYSVNLWVVAIDDVAYIHAGDNRTNWVEHLESDPSARMRVDESIYTLRAARVSTQEEFDRFSVAYDAKFGIQPRNGNVDEVYLFRLEAP